MLQEYITDTTKEEASTYKYEIREVTKAEALNMVQKYHYSNTLPRLNKHYVGFYLGGELVGVVTLGWGTRPLHTIKKIFPSLETKDYFEIGRMCMTDDMPRNSESQMLSQLVKWIKVNCPEIKVLFTWADGIKIHPRQTRQLFKSGEDDKRITVRPTAEQMAQHGIEHYKGKQFKYLLFVCDRRKARELKGECLEPLSKQYPKDNSLEWKEKNEAGKWVLCSRPPYKTDTEIKDMVNRLAEERYIS